MKKSHDANGIFIKYIMKKLPVLLLLTGLVPLISACKQSPDYFSYVSELRSDLFTASAEEFR